MAGALGIGLVDAYPLPRSSSPVSDTFGCITLNAMCIDFYHKSFMWYLVKCFLKVNIDKFYRCIVVRVISVYDLCKETKPTKVICASLGGHEKWITLTTAYLYYYKSMLVQLNIYWAIWIRLFLYCYACDISLLLCYCLMSVPECCHLCAISVTSSSVHYRS